MRGPIARGVIAVMPMESLGFHGACLSHVGRVREHNEDALVIAGLMVFGTSMPEPIECALRHGTSWGIAVADGMGGASAGEVASRKTVEAFAGLTTWSMVNVTELLKRLNDQFYELGRQDPALTGMGSAVAGLCCGIDGSFAFNVGVTKQESQ